MAINESRLSYVNVCTSALITFFTGFSLLSYTPRPPPLTPVTRFSFNRLDLPAYGSYQVLRDRLVKAIESPQVFDGVD